MRIAASLFLLVHGIAHLVGFLTPWHLLPAATEGTTPPSTNMLLGGRLVLGEGAAKGLGIAWLALFLAFAVVAFGVWKQASWSRSGVVAVALVSLLFSLAWWPTARIGVYVNVAILLVLAAIGYRAYRRDIAVERARAFAGSRVIETTCGPIEYASLGEGTPVLVLHGTGGGWDQGIFAARGLVEHGFRIIAPSRFGYLRTPMPADPSPRAEADTWACLLDALHLDRVAVMSYSAGAAPSIQLALRHPDRVSSLVLFVPAAGGIMPPQAAGPPAFVMNVVLRFDFPMWLAMHAFPNVMYKVAAVPPAFVATAAPAEVERLEQGIRMILPISLRKQGMMNDARSQSGSEPIYPIEQITAPTLLFSAEDDLYRTLNVARQVAAVIPEATLISFKTGGHFLLGHDAEVWPTVAGFLRDRQETDQRVALPAHSATARSAR
jgi:2-hydroxy-6-oxonona-2,4-dienedioate hydrolase